MKPDIDTIVEDILRDNPELAPEAEALRVLVSELAAKQPHITVDEAFKARLRAKLVSGAVAAPATKRSVLPWWLIYTVPVGVTALLLLVIQPPYATAPVVPTTTDTTESTESTEQVIESSETSDAPSGGGFNAVPSMMYMETAPAMKGGGGDGTRIYDTGMAEDAVEMAAPAGTNDYFTAEFMPDRGAVLITHLSVTSPAYIAIGGADGVVVVSGLFLPGEHVNVVLPVNGRIAAGQSYTAILYYDNGDGVYTEGFETMALDYTGTPISMELIAP